MKFAEKLKLRRNLMIMFILLGLCAIVLGIVKICLADNVGFINYYFATGLALLVVSGRKLRQTLRALSDKEKYESLYIKEHDEWNTMTLLKATYYAFATAALLSYVLSLVLLFANSIWFPPFVTANAIYAAFYVFYIIVMRRTIKENLGEDAK